MSEYVLQPCRVVRTAFVPAKLDPLVLNWRELVGKLAPKGELLEVQKLAGLKKGCYVGLSKRTRAPGNTVFIFQNHAGGGDFTWVANQDRTFQDRIVEAYLVESAVRDGKIIESESKKEEKST